MYHLYISVVITPCKYFCNFISVCGSRCQNSNKKLFFEIISCFFYLFFLFNLFIIFFFSYYIFKVLLLEAQCALTSGKELIFQDGALPSKTDGHTQDCHDNSRVYFHSNQVHLWYSSKHPHIHVLIGTFQPITGRKIIQPQRALTTLTTSLKNICQIFFNNSCFVFTIIVY